MRPPLPPARAARLAAGLTLDTAARRARVSAGYLLRLERTGRFPLPLARRLVRLYGGAARLDLFLPTGTGTARSADAGAGGCRSPRPSGRSIGRGRFPTPAELGHTPDELEQQHPEAPLLVGHDGAPCVDARDLDALADLDGEHEAPGDLWEGPRP